MSEQPPSDNIIRFSDYDSGGGTRPTSPTPTGSTPIVGGGNGGGGGGEMDARVRALESDMTEIKVTLREIATTLQHVATKEDVANLRTELKGDIAELRTELKGEIADVRSELTGKFEGSRADLQKDIQSVRSDAREVGLKTMRWSVGALSLTLILGMAAVETLHQVRTAWSEPTPAEQSARVDAEAGASATPSPAQEPPAPAQ